MNFFDVLGAINAVMLSVPVLMALLGVGILFTFWSGFGQYRALTHGVALISGKGIRVERGDSGVLSHFQALSAALSATVGLGNIGGVAIAVSLGGPGAVFWMWMVGLAGMALKSTEVILALLFRDTDDRDNPHGGTMWVCKKGFSELSPRLARLGAVLGAAFTVPLILFGFAGGCLFQSWNVAEITRVYFDVPPWMTATVTAMLVGAVILGGIRRIGRIAGVLVPFMCGFYLISGIYVLLAHAGDLPEMFRQIFHDAFAPTEAVGAFTGGAFGTAFVFGMKRALYSSESGLGSAPIAHSAVKTPEPVTEGVVAGLEPFVDTLVVCTITALVILASGVWQRGPAAPWYAVPPFIAVAPGQWKPASDLLPPAGAEPWQTGDQVFVVARLDDGSRARVYGTIVGDADSQSVAWRPLASAQPPQLAENGIFIDYPGSTLTAKAFDSATPGLGRWMVTLTVWLFAISTMITWSYYGEQGVVYLLGARWVTPYRLLWCALIAAAGFGFIRTDYQLDAISTVAIGFMLAINLPTMVILGPKAMRAYHDYFRRLKAGQIRRR